MHEAHALVEVVAVVDDARVRGDDKSGGTRAPARTARVRVPRGAGPGARGAGRAAWAARREQGPGASRAPPPTPAPVRAPAAPAGPVAPVGLGPIEAPAAPPAGVGVRHAPDVVGEVGGALDVARVRHDDAERGAGRRRGWPARGPWGTRPARGPGERAARTRVRVCGVRDARRAPAAGRGGRRAGAGARAQRRRAFAFAFAGAGAGTRERAGAPAAGVAGLVLRRRGRGASGPWPRPADGAHVPDGALEGVGAPDGPRVLHEHGATRWRAARAGRAAADGDDGGLAGPRAPGRPRKGGPRAGRRAARGPAGPPAPGLRPAGAGERARAGAAEGRRAQGTGGPAGAGPRGPRRRAGRGQGPAARAPARRGRPRGEDEPVPAGLRVVPVRPRRRVAVGGHDGRNVVVQVVGQVEVAGVLHNDEERAAARALHSRV